MSEKLDSLSRRIFLKRAAIAAGALGFAPAWISGCAQSLVRNQRSAELKADDPWNAVAGIIRRIKPPAFPARDFDVTAFGAVSGDLVDSSDAFRKAIAACSAAGGGRVVVGAGKFLTGPIHLRSNVNLHLERGAVVLFSTDSSKYLPVVLTRFEGVELMNCSPLIYALDCENVAVTGEGTLDGQASAANWWKWKGNPDFGWEQGTPNGNVARKNLFDMAERGVPVSERVFGAGQYLRPPFIETYRCRNVLIEGVTILNSPMWEIHPVLCRNVTVRGVSISSLGPNNDGCNPESSSDVLIEKCFFNTGDDCIAIKSGRNADGRRIGVPSENIVVRNCEMRDGHGGVTLGSEISGGVRNVFAENCTMNSPHLNWALRLKNNAARGGLLEHIYMRNVTVGEVSDAILQVDFLYEEGASGKFTPIVRDLELRNVTSRKSNYGVYIHGIPNGTIDNVRIIDCRFDNVAKGNVVERVTGLRMQNTTINGVRADT